MSEWRNENPRTFEQHVLANRDFLYRLSTRLTGNTADANYLVQETLLKAFLHRHKYEEGTNINAWLCRILKNTFITIYRKQMKETTAMENTETAAPIFTEQCQ